MLPYFEALLDHLGRGDTVARQALGEHVHWGYWDNPTTAPVSAEDFDRAAQLMVEQVLQRASVRDEMRILDVGCGLGGTIKYLNEKYRDCALVGVNIDERQLAVATNNVRAKHGNIVSFTQGDACQLDLPAGSFDIILCVESIFHFSSRHAFLSRCARILAPGGTLVISDFVPIRYVGVVLDFLERTTSLVGKMYGELHLNVSISRYRALANVCGLELSSADDVTSHTLPTYKFLKDNLARAENRKAFIRATRLIELASRIGLVRYRILTFKKQGST